MSILNGIILGIIQGLGEFLPISSSGHLLLTRILLGIQTDTPALKMLDILLHVGTLIPVLIVFRREWLHMIAHPIKDRTLLMLIVASLPTLAIYLLAKKLFPDVNGFAVFDNGWFLGCSFLITAVFLMVADRLAANRRPEKGVGVPQALSMGVFQGIGMIPGVSRSGSTILGGTAAGLDKQTAARFSFMMSAPAILGSLLMEGKDALEEGYFSQIDWAPTLLGILFAALFGILAIRFMLRIISRISLSWFSLYLAVLGVVYLLLQLSGSSLVPAFVIPAGALG